MPMDTVDAHLVTQFSDMMHVKAQQIKSRLRPYVDIKKMTGEDMAYDGLGDVEARELTGRFNKTQFDDIEHLRRQIVKRRFTVTLPIDKKDIEGRLKDPQSEYAASCVRAMERVFDRVVYDAMFADVKTGRNFQNTVNFAADGGSTVNATGGLTYPKLLEIRQNFLDNEVGNDSNVDILLGISGDEHTAMMQLTQLINGDYSREYVVDKGEIVKAVGMELVKFGASARRPVLQVATGVRSCFAMATGGICVGLSSNWDITIKDRPDYVDTKQVQIVGTLGAVRTEGKLIQKVTTTD